MAEACEAQATGNKEKGFFHIECFRSEIIIQETEVLLRFNAKHKSEAGCIF